MDATAKQLQEIKDSVGSVLTRAVIEEITRIRIPWNVTPQQQQQDTIDRVRATIDHAVAHAVRRIATGGFDSVAVEIESLAVKDDGKVTLVLPRGTDEVHVLLDHVKGKALLVFADPAEFAAQANAVKAQADQPALPLE